MKVYKAISIHITGLVQGVGFRPFIFRLANSLGILGWVENGNDGVRIHAQGKTTDLELFTNEIRIQAPAASRIQDIFIHEVDFQDLSHFIIRKSEDYSDEVTEVSPDIAVCEDCLSDLKSQVHRIDYPLINCTNCGPRFSIIKALPYDRPFTTMASFHMCPVCDKEYHDPRDRRFHAQPVACNNCGPVYELIIGGKHYTGIHNIINLTCRLLKEGKLIAMKGTGGFHLACDATREEAVSRLRQKKYRESKPFAVMFKNLEECHKYLDISAREEELLLSWRRPVVIVKNKQDGKQLAPSVSNHFGTTGIMLPYMPLHHLMFEQLELPAIVLTSGNLSDEPVIIDNEIALQRLDQVADAFLLYNREIYNRADDSVAFFAAKKSRLIRRSRGYAPAPVNLEMNVDGIFAAGAELVNCFCLGKGNKAIMSQHIGDLKNLETLDFFTESFHRFSGLFRSRPELIAVDLHPDYLSTRFAEEYADQNGRLPVVRIQHHHAHIASCMAEHGLDEDVIGISMDGVGYGTDGHIWGFEVFKCNLLDFERLTHLDYTPQPGGDKANAEPWRMALSYLNKYMPEESCYNDLFFLRQIPADQISTVLTALKNNINTPLTSSAGRLFDAVAAMAGVCSYSAFHAEAPMRLEQILDHNETGAYQFNAGTTIDAGPVIKNIVEDLKNKVTSGRISARFHRAIVNLLVELALKCRSEFDISKIVLSGGTFQNRFILENTENELIRNGFSVFTQENIPSNDGGIALGQLVIAAKMRKNGFI